MHRRSGCWTTGAVFAISALWFLTLCGAVLLAQIPSGDTNVGHSLAWNQDPGDAVDSFSDSEVSNSPHCIQVDLSQSSQLQALWAEDREVSADADHRFLFSRLSLRGPPSQFTSQS